jgi:hypothetical protein
MKNKCLQWKSGMYISTEGNVRLLGLFNVS